jgi:hypothetical protein
MPPMLELVKYAMLRDMAKSPQRPHRPSDPIALAKLVGDIATGQATGQVEDKPIPDPTPDEVRRVMSALGKRGGPKGGAARALALSEDRRKEIAQGGAAARWGKKKV